MGMGFAPTWLRQVSPPLLHKTTLTTDTTALRINISACVVGRIIESLTKPRYARKLFYQHPAVLR